MNKKPFEEDSMEPILEEKEKLCFLVLTEPKRVVVKGVGTILEDGTALGLDGVATGKRNELGPVSRDIAACFVGAKGWRVVEK
jgi:hypothetical protein